MAGDKRYLRVIPFFLLTLALVAQADTDFERQCAKLVARGHDASRLSQLFELTWRHALADSPESATGVGERAYNALWTDYSAAAIARRKRELEAPMRVLRSIDPAKLDARARLDYELFRYDAELSLDGRKFRDELMPINQLGGLQQTIPGTLLQMPTDSEKAYADVIARLDAIPTLVDQVMALLREGLAAGVTPPRITLRNVPAQVTSLLDDDIRTSPLLAPFRKFPADFTVARQEQWRQKALTSLHTRVFPALTRLRDYLEKTYVPSARESIAITALPDGKAWYTYAIRASTTLALTAEKIHQIGLDEVRRIRHEMEKVMKEAAFRGTLAEFFEYLRTDGRFFHHSADELLRAYRDIAKRIDPELPRLFGKLPRLTYGVKAVPAYSEKSQTTGYYEPGSPKAGRAGYFNANTYDLKARPIWEMEALTAHEAVPGHHLQIALAQEMENVPEFRRNSLYNAFVEGWGLYSESLGYDIGLYRDPYSHFGQLAYEMWRAIRLVVDTGIHSMGWSRDKAITFFRDNSPKTQHDIEVEVDRYIVWPGQALAYKLGQLKISALRDEAEHQLGSRFDLRTFHDVVLGNGSVPLPVLEREVRAWITKVKGQ